MGRVIKIESAGKDRNQLVKAIVLAMRELGGQTEPDQHTRDILAFITLSLEAIAQTIDESVSAWEKRGYWIKADRFRMEWQWARLTADGLRKALLAENWEDIASSIAKIGGRLAHIKAPSYNRIGSPWVGAWEHFIQS